MIRPFESRAYQAESLNGCFWLEDFPGADLHWPQLQGEARTDVAIIGAGYTGLSAALHLAQAGVDVTVLDMHAPGWGASGRNGGFCCLGGAKASAARIVRTYGHAAAEAWGQAQIDAIALVRNLLRVHQIDADTHSNGETVLAHSARSYRALQAQADAHGLEFIPTQDLPQHGMNASGLRGGVTVPYGFGLHPRKYVLGLARAARDAGARIFQNAGVQRIERTGGGYVLHTPSGQVRADRIIVATNGYSADDVPAWMRARFLPVQSNILVTRPLSLSERQDQGWTTDQMVYDTRQLLRYFRLLPSGHMMFGMRGGIRATPASDRKMHYLIRADFDRMFPAWTGVEAPWFWTGLVCMTARQVPFVGPITEMPGAFAGFGWHGNGIAMGTYAGRLLAQVVQGQGQVPAVMQRPARKLPLGRFRRAMLPPIYAGLSLLDRVS